MPCAGVVTLWSLFTPGLARRAGDLPRTSGLRFFFIFCAVPWPQRAETGITQSLSRGVAFCTVEMLQWAGIAAERAGNLVALPSGMIEVSDACSGVRSLQSTLMAALCLGEVRRFSFRRRVILVAIGVALALILNVARNFFLALVANRMGLGAIKAWHDSAGWGIFLLSFCLLAAISRAMIARGGACGAEGSGVFPALRPLPCWAGAGFAAWFALGFAGTEGWYRWHERNVIAGPRLKVTWPEKAVGFRFEEISDTALNLLMASEVRAASWEAAPGRRWTLTAVRWAPGETATQTARMHFPEVCLPAAGSVFLGRGPNVAISIPGGSLSFRVFEFLVHGRKAFVFFCLHEEANRDQDRDDLLQGEWSSLEPPPARVDGPAKPRPRKVSHWRSRARMTLNRPSAWERPLCRARRSGSALFTPRPLTGTRLTYAGARISLQLAGGFAGHDCHRISPTASFSSWGTGKIAMPEQDEAPTNPPRNPADPPASILSFPNTRFYPEARLLVWRPTGVFDDTLADLVVTFLEAEERTAPPFHRYTDFGGLTTVQLRVGHTFAIAERRKRVRQQVKSVFFADRTVSLGVARMYETLMEDAIIEVRAFRERQAAADWLDVPLELLLPPG